MPPEHVTAFIALHERKAVAFHLVLKFKDLWISEHSGNVNGAVNGTNQLLYWETIRQAQLEGAKKFSFGRTSAANEGLLAYKRRWAPLEEDIFEFVYPASEKARLPEDTPPREQSLAYRMMRSFLSHAPMPLYRLVGNYCYRHLG
jgi:lipid II:glycine glycyltransferase (peptidoglycan interpeptide bridge formation enzyme)